MPTTLVLLIQKIAHMRQKLEAMQKQAARVGLKVNASKTTKMRIRFPANAGNISCAGEALARVTAFTYLGSLINTKGGTEEDVEARCRKVQAGFFILIETNMEIKSHRGGLSIKNMRTWGCHGIK